MVFVLGSVAHAEPLWVDADRVDEARAAAAELWPGGLDVAARPAELDGDGLVWKGARLYWIRGGRAWIGDAPDAATVVVLARAWMREPPATGAGWVPEVDLSEPAPTPIEPEVPVDPWPQAAGAEGFAGVGGGFGLGTSTDEVARVSVGWLGRSLEVSATGTLVVRRDERRPELGSLGIGGGWTLGAPRRIPGHWSAGPVVVGGIEAAALDDRAELLGLVGAGAEVWRGTRGGLAISLVDRLDPRLRQRVSIVADLRATRR